MSLAHLLCRLGWHAPLPAGRWNGGYCFTSCRRCGRDMVRSAFGEWRVPRDFRITWGPRPPGDLDASLQARFGTPAPAEEVAPPTQPEIGAPSPHAGTPETQSAPDPEPPLPPERYIGPSQPPPPRPPEPAAEAQLSREEPEVIAPPPAPPPAAEDRPPTPAVLNDPPSPAGSPFDFDDFDDVDPKVDRRRKLG